jgi:hypothetical protein
MCMYVYLYVRMHRKELRVVKINLVADVCSMYICMYVTFEIFGFNSTESHVLLREESFYRHWNGLYQAKLVEVGIHLLQCCARERETYLLR